MFLLPDIAVWSNDVSATELLLLPDERDSLLDLELLFVLEFVEDMEDSVFVVLLVELDVPFCCDELCDNEFADPFKLIIEVWLSWPD